MRKKTGRWYFEVAVSAESGNSAPDSAGALPTQASLGFLMNDAAEHLKAKTEDVSFGSDSGSWGVHFGGSEIACFAAHGG